MLEHCKFPSKGSLAKLRWFNSTEAVGRKLDLVFVPEKSKLWGALEGHGSCHWYNHVQLGNGSSGHNSYLRRRYRPAPNCGSTTGFLCRHDVQMLLWMSQKLKSPLNLPSSSEPRRSAGVKQLDNPYRAIIDAGVIVGLSRSAALRQPAAGAVNCRQQLQVPEDH